jgi:hypothetical protein
MPTFNPIYFFKKIIYRIFFQKIKKNSTNHGSTINASKKELFKMFLEGNAKIPSNFFLYFILKIK